MKKITLLAILALILLILINPSKINIFNKENISADNIKEMSSIDFTGEIQYVEYKDRLCLLNDNKFKVIDEDGKEIHSKEIQPENTKLTSNKYIDILNKKTNNGISINEDGKILFNTKVSPETFLYESINEYVFVSAYKDGDKEVMKILDKSGELNSKVEVDGKITNIKSLDKYILVSYISIKEDIKNKIALYDENGNLKKEIEFNNIILDILNMNGSIYVVFENNIEILDEGLSKKGEVRAEGINLVEKSNENYIFIRDDKGRLGYIQNEEYKDINTKGEMLNAEGIKEGYVLYSDKVIYNNNLKQIISFDEEIKDIKYIGGNSVAVIFKNNIKIFKLL